MYILLFRVFGSYTDSRTPRDHGGLRDQAVAHRDEGSWLTRAEVEGAVAGYSQEGTQLLAVEGVHDCSHLHKE